MSLPVRGLSALLLLSLCPVVVSSAPVEPPPALLAQWGSSGTDESSFSGPSAIAVDGMGKVYALETDNQRIQKFEGDGTFLRMWGWGVSDGSSTLQICTSGCQAGTSGGGDGQFNTAEAIAVDVAGTVYVADSGARRIQVFASDGSFLRMWGWGVADGSAALQTCTSGCQAGIPGSGDGQFSSPEGVAVDGSGNVFVSDESNARIQVFDSSGKFLRKWGSIGSDDGQFAAPKHVAVSKLGHVYVVDRFNDRIQKFDSSGTFLTKWGSTGTGDGQFDRPVGVAVDPSGNVYVVDEDNSRVQKFDSGGNFLTKWGTLGSGDGEFAFPKGVAAFASGYIYVIEHGNARIQKFGGPWLDVFVGQPLPRPE